MTSYADYMGSNAFSNAYKFYQKLMDDLYDQSHGASKYALSQLPLSGYIRRQRDEGRRWEDSYNQTGIDPVYSSAYGHSGSAGLLGIFGGAAGVRRMARSLSEMHTPEVMEDCEFHKYRMARPQIGGKNLIGKNTDIDMEEY